MTEEEAKTKWCPMVRHSDGETPGANRWNMGTNIDPKWGTPNNPSACRCIASDCMMWVETDRECEPEMEPKDPTADRPEPICRPAGYCGLVK